MSRFGQPHVLGDVCGCVTLMPPDSSVGSILGIGKEVQEEGWGRGGRPSRAAVWWGLDGRQTYLRLLPGSVVSEALPRF